MHHFAKSLLMLSLCCVFGVGHAFAAEKHKVGSKKSGNASTQLNKKIEKPSKAKVSLKKASVAEKKSSLSKQKLVFSKTKATAEKQKTTLSKTKPLTSKQKIALAKADKIRLSQKTTEKPNLTIAKSKKTGDFSSYIRESNGKKVLVLPASIAKPSVEAKIETAETPSSAKVVKVAYQPQTLDTFIANQELKLFANYALVYRQDTGELVYNKNSEQIVPIASVTKLMTAMVTLDAGLDMNEVISISEDEIDRLRGTGSRLKVGVSLTRAEMLHLALMSSENRAAHTLARNYPGGVDAFIARMNRKAASLGMSHTQFMDPTGLTEKNRSTAADLAKMVAAAYTYPEIRQASTTGGSDVLPFGSNNTLKYHNSNALVRSPNWQIGVSKTGYIGAAGRCLVMQATIVGKPYIIVLLDSATKNSRLGDAERIKNWIESQQSTSIRTAS